MCPPRCKLSYLNLRAALLVPSPCLVSGPVAACIHGREQCPSGAGKSSACTLQLTALSTQTSCGQRGAEKAACSFVRLSSLGCDLPQISGYHAVSSSALILCCKLRECTAEIDCPWVMQGRSGTVSRLNQEPTGFFSFQASVHAEAIIGTIYLTPFRLADVYVYPCSRTVFFLVRFPVWFGVCRSLEAKPQSVTLTNIKQAWLKNKTSAEIY